MKSDKLDKYKEPEVVRKERLRMSKSMSQQVIPNKKKDRNEKIDILELEK